MDTPGRKPSRIETIALFKEIANQTHLPEDTVRLVMDTFIAITKDAVAVEDRVVIRHFGTFQARRIKSGVMIKFKASDDFKKAVQEVIKPMEKYGVETKTDAALVAQVTGKCPTCNQDLESTKPPKCSNCGTEPFESKEQK